MASMLLRDTFTRPYWEVEDDVPGQNVQIEPPQPGAEVQMSPNDGDKVVEEDPYYEERRSSFEACCECLQQCGPVIWMISGCCCLLLTILAIILIACSFETIESTEMGIAYNAPQAIRWTLHGCWPTSALA